MIRWLTKTMISTLSSARWSELIISQQWISCFFFLIIVVKPFVFETISFSKWNLHSAQEKIVFTYTTNTYTDQCCSRLVIFQCYFGIKIRLLIASQYWIVQLEQESVSVIKKKTCSKNWTYDAVLKRRRSFEGDVDSSSHSQRHSVLVQWPIYWSI